MPLVAPQQVQQVQAQQVQAEQPDEVNDEDGDDVEPVPAPKKTVVKKKIVVPVKSNK